MGTIINLAQNYVGSNNINLLQPIGQVFTNSYGINTVWHHENPFLLLSSAPAWRVERTTPRRVTSSLRFDFIF